MNNTVVKTPEELLKDLDSCLKKSGMSPEEFLNSFANFYNIKDIVEKDIIDSGSYYDSFIA
ncbi:hypothetical protein [Clostridium aciditolerans]|uniref:Uncharacterized protein n=1 Tax=Clostridium aciditolerans TaxID=339861 RepID=A0A934M925_9CLOT|nr:hypothetical protein [Clostridium aciditolerans]MBI6875416.1 hypothetical protein [Clostridium aciditolerans]MTK11858.1 hypothetical protein [Clostridiaceae bacterium]